MKQIQRVARAGKIEIEAGILRMHPVIGEIVDPPKTQRRPKVISFPSMIVNHIEDHFDAGSVQTAYHCLELGDLLAHLPTTGVFAMRCEKPDRVIAPEVRYAAIDQEFVVDVRVHGE